MPKLITLLKDHLRELLLENDLDTSGTKADMVERLKKHYNTDEIDQTTINALIPDTKVQKELSDMKDMVRALTQTVHQLSEQMVAQNVQRPRVDAEEASAKSEECHNREDENSINDQHDNVSLHSSTATIHYQLAATRHHYSVREIAETIPEYDPTKETSLSAEQFVRHVDEARNIYEWEEKCLLLAVYSQLKGAARMWLDCRQTLFTTWNDFKKEILNEFGTSLDEAEVSNIMKKTTRRPDEKVVDYCFRIHALGTRFVLSEAAIVRYAREGMKHRDLQIATATMKFSGMKQFRQTVAEYFANMPSTSRQTKEFVATQSNRHDKRSQKYEPVEKPKYTQDVTCYNCNGRGHLSKNCLKPQKKERCTICQRTTHKMGECPENQSTITPNRSNINSITDSDNTYNEVVRKIEINGMSLKSCIDSGSPASLIRKKCSEKFGELLQTCWKKLSGFAGGSYVVTRKLPTTVSIDDHKFDVELLVVEDEDIPEDVLIGRDLICRKGNRLVIEDGECRVERSNADQVAYVIKLPQNAEVQQLLTENENCIAENLADIIHELLECEIIRPSQSHYASPVPKTNGEHRLCVDYTRCLNKITRRIPFPMPKFGKFCQSNHSYHVKTAVRTPRANDQVKRTNATILDALRTSTENELPVEDD